ncbi:MAG: signal peptide peptidase SppA [Desulfopila sp.]|jgi:protease-4|nr:signal peptide peptidase SppA [Desulfopila sp.]
MKDLIKSIFTILKYGGKAVTIFRNIIINTLFFILFFTILVSYLSKEEQKIENETALLLNISGDIVEEQQEIDPIGEFLNDVIGFTSIPEETLLQDILDAINNASQDSHIKALVLDMSKMGNSSFNQIHDIGNALQSFKASGKTVIAAEDFYSQNKYLLASYADKIFLNPAGLVDLHGLGSYRLYFHDALEKLQVNYHVFRVGEYKSAVEPLTRNSMSTEARAQNTIWLNALWQNYIDNITARRGISPETIDLYTNSITTLLTRSNGDTAQLALDTNLVDGLKSRHELRSYLAEITFPSPTNGFRYVPLKDYLKKIPRSYINESYSGNHVGIIIAQGNILPGEQPAGSIGSDSLLQLLREARNDRTIRAVVLRISSGGGSVFASEMIRRELQVLKDSGKPFVVSMGSMAASGGYWIAAEADEILAYPTTLTGSIGIFGAIPTFEDSLAGLGIYNDGVGTTNLSSGLDLTQPLSPEIQKSVQLSIEHGYKKFLDIVSTGRQLSSNQLDRVAEGRVFDGVTAQELGLVDKIGNLQDAIEAAASLANLENYSARYIKNMDTFSMKVLRQIQGKIAAALEGSSNGIYFKQHIQNFTESAADILLFNDPRGIYAHCMINPF